MSRIQDIVTQIRHAVFGTDVRENIALGIETCYNEEVEKNEALQIHKLNKPDSDGQNGMLLQSNGDGSTSWTSYASPTYEQVATAVDNWLDNNPWATTTVEDKSLTEIKFTDKLKAQTFPILNLKYKTVVQKDVWNNNFLSNYNIQSVCYDSYRDRYIVGFNDKTDETRALLVVMKELDFSLDPSTNIIASRSHTYRHCNDIAYYPGSGDGTDDVVYIAPGNARVWKMNPDTLETIGNITFSDLGDGEGIWNVSVYSDGSIYLNTGNEARKYDSSFSSYTVVSTNDNQNIQNYFGITEQNAYMCSQGSFIYNDVPYMIYNSGEPVKDGWWSVYIVGFNANGLVFARKVATEYEVEACDVVGNKLEFVCGQTWMTTAETYLDVPDTSDPQVTRHAIPDNADLNDYKTPGTYFSQNAATSNTLLNIPEDAKGVGFTMEVFRSGWDNVRQIIYTNGFWEPASIFTRGYANGPKQWGHWYVLTGNIANSDSKQLTNYEMFGTYGYITTNGTELMLSLPFNFSDEYSTINITKLTISLRTASGGYVLGNGTDITQYITDSTTKLLRYRQGLIYLSIIKSDGWGVTNNTPVVGSCNISCTFGFSS